MPSFFFLQNQFWLQLLLSCESVRQNIFQERQPSFAPFQLMLLGATAPIADLAPGWEAVLTSDEGAEVYYWNK
jgi:hypothetical protein